ncbi:E3 ubiquitin-protein ligase RKP isoform X1 [Solanum stenotomum]|uniref:E3 ubiquitin-protein ligase RKP isoform X1 n=1 Tax=Solanum stenotomum TaxID=172797 RepID=UPI0020D1F0F1|nr:E3 ubiquitin-protein ligase RKP isoform X1 [Solanum stenotomum]XP_049387198.1 E3 ubiquitin-protein ligase RKP isoform X1 [Solanum stenotomum]
MAEDGLRIGIGGLSSGLAVVLNGEDRKESSQKTHLVSYCDGFGDQSVERTLEHIFDLPYKCIKPLSCSIDAEVVRSVIKNEFLKYHTNQKTCTDRKREGVLTAGGDGCKHQVIQLEESSICGDIRIVKQPLIMESHSLFSSARANACVWKGKWMYEVTLETSGIQQLGWATLSCPFTDHKGVGDADDSYAYDGKRVSKWNKEAQDYGQPWVVGDVIGCCIDLDGDEISFYRNGVSLGVAFIGIRKMVPGLGYYPAISLSQGERCELNFGEIPFRYPVKGFLPIQPPPTKSSTATDLLNCFRRLIEMQRVGRAEFSSVEKLRRLKRFVSFEKLSHPVSRGICEELFSTLAAEDGSTKYISCGPLLSLIMEVFRMHPPHDYMSLDSILDSLLEFPESRILFEHIISSLSTFCKTAPLSLAENCPYSGSYIYLALACHILRREEVMTLWWRSSDFDLLFEGFLSRKSPNKQDLQGLMPSIWWSGSCEDVSNEASLLLTTGALSEIINKVEEKQRDLCRLVMQFMPPTSPPQLPGSVFKTFLQNILLKNRGADRDSPPPGVSSNSVLVSLFGIVLHFLSEGFGDICDWMKDSGTSDVGFLHRGGQQAFPVGLFLKNDPHRVDIPRLGGSYNHLAKSHPISIEQHEEVIRWEEGCMDNVEDRVTHLSKQKPCCCSTYDADFTRISKNSIRHMGKGSRGHCSSIRERSAHVAAECSTSSLNDDIADKPSTSDQSESEFGFLPIQQMRYVPRENNVSSATLKEEELLDTMLLLYHLGLAPNFKQASLYMNRQSQSISLLEETDKQIRENVCREHVKRLKEVRGVYREEVMDCVRHCAWYRISLFSRWKQRGMYAACMWIVQLLLILSKEDSVFLYIPEYYLETLVDCFHVLRKSDPPFVPATIFLKQGLTSFVTFVVTHFNDPRISSVELRDLLLQSIYILVQYKEFLSELECNEAAMQRMPKALLSAFDNRSWIPVTNILLRLCKGSGFGSSKRGESSSSSSVIYQKLLREVCLHDEELFSTFLNHLFNTLSWAMTEFSVSVREMQESYKVLEFQQRKCSVIFDLSCNLARILEFCTHEIPKAFISGVDTNLRRLTEVIVFILNHLISAADQELFDLCHSCSFVRRPGQPPEKLNRGMILAPLAGIILNLLDASRESDTGDNDMVGIFASMDCPDTVVSGLQYLLEYNWASLFRGDDYLEKIRQLEIFSGLLICQSEVVEVERIAYGGETDYDDSICCICYTSQANAQFVPCSHVSCFGCISRHLLNCERCFFCNATVLEVLKTDANADQGHFSNLEE